MSKFKHGRALLAATILSAGYAGPALAQSASSAEGGSTMSGNDIIVTAQRVEQRLQDVPIAITVFNQEKLDNNNILSAKDIATYTPGVYAQTRYGNDTTTYTIRGFAQEQRTTATVGTYFAEVVAPRGNGVSQGGDGASPGALFDLQNVQVLKGPQGTLFGRNTTGGAVLLVPVKPRDKFEGYIEGTAGDLNRWRVQGVINVPLGDTLRVRLGVDRQKRDGYIKNIGITPKHNKDMGSIDILALRGSVVWDVTPDIENYLIVSYSKSQSSGAIPLIKKVFQNRAEIGCTSPPLPAASLAALCPANAAGQLSFTGLANAQVAREQATGDWWTGTNANPLGEAFNEELRFINRTEFNLNDSLTLTNLFGYSEFKGNNSVDAFGLNAPLKATPALPTDYFSYVPINAHPDYGLTANQRSVVEELRLTGETGALNWQAGLYFEKSSPKDFTGTFTVTAGSCADILLYHCSNSTGATAGPTKIWNTTLAAYAQGTYRFSEKFAITAGLRYTEDKTRAVFANGRVRFTPADNWASNTYECSFPGHPDSGPNPTSVTLRYPNTPENRATKCFYDLTKKTSAPTWTINLEYKPTSDILTYANHSL